MTFGEGSQHNSNPYIHKLCCFFFIHKCHVSQNKSLSVRHIIGLISSSPNLPPLSGLRAGMTPGRLRALSRTFGNFHSIFGLLDIKPIICHTDKGSDQKLPWVTPSLIPSVTNSIVVMLRICGASLKQRVFKTLKHQADNIIHTATVLIHVESGSCTFMVTHVLKDTQQ